MLVDNKISVPAFSQSKASFSVIPLSFMLFSKTDMMSWNKFTKKNKIYSGAEGSSCKKNLNCEHKDQVQFIISILPMKGTKKLKQMS